MVNPSKELPIWNTAAAAMWEQFFLSPIGRSGLERLAALRPALTALTLEASALAGARACGYEGCLANLMNLSVSEEAIASSNAAGEQQYPPLEDEEAWKQLDNPQK